jgi:hypothetical protein
MKWSTISSSVNRAQQTIVLFIPRRRAGRVPREELRISYWNAPAGRAMPAPAPVDRLVIADDPLAAAPLAAAPPLALQLMWLIIWALLAIIVIWAVREVYAALGWYQR